MENISNELILSYKKEIERLKKLPATKQNLEELGTISHMYQTLCQLHKLANERNSIDQAQKKLLEATAIYIQENFKATEEFERAYVEVMKMYERRLNNESN